MIVHKMKEPESLFVDHDLRIIFPAFLNPFFSDDRVIMKCYGDSKFIGITNTDAYACVHTDSGDSVQVARNENGQVSIKIPDNIASLLGLSSKEHGGKNFRAGMGVRVRYISFSEPV
jgi:hypothetical protein